MAYTRVNWEDLPSTNTPRNATNLNIMDAGIKENDDKLNGTKPMGSIVVDDVNCKNLLSDYTIVNGWISGTTMRVYSENGNRMAFIPCQPNTTYTVSRSVLTGTFRVGEYTSVPVMTSSNVDYTIPTCITDNNASSITYTTTANAKYLIVHYGLLEDSNLQASFDTIQVEVGSTATGYTKGKKIIKEQNGYVKENTTFYADDFKCRNMFDPSSMIELNGQVRRYSDGVIVNVSGYYGIKVPVSANTTYTISSNLTSRDKISNLCYFNGTTYISGEAFGSGSLSFTTPNNCNYITFALSNEYTWCQLEVGSEATPYIPYKNFDNTSYVLWTNSSPSSAFAAGDATLNDSLANYQFYEVLAKTYSTENMIISSGKIPTSFSGELSRLALQLSRYRSFTNGTTKLTFSAAQGIATNASGSATTNNDWLVPYMILGYK